MTIYGTPGGTPLNTSGFQGTTPGNPVGATLPALPQQVGLFSPNSNNQGAGTILDAASRATVPANIQITNTLAGTGRPNALLERMGESGPVGSTSTIGGASGYHPLTNSANGGSGPGAGGMNQDLGANSGRSDSLAGAMPAPALSTATPPNYVG